jgi:hypothetical protein
MVSFEVRGDGAIRVDDGPVALPTGWRRLNNGYVNLDTLYFLTLDGEFSRLGETVVPDPRIGSQPHTFAVTDTGILVDGGHIPLRYATALPDQSATQQVSDLGSAPSAWRGGAPETRPPEDARSAVGGGSPVRRVRWELEASGVGSGGEQGQRQGNAGAPSPTAASTRPPERRQFTLDVVRRQLPAQIVWTPPGPPIAPPAASVEADDSPATQRAAAETAVDVVGAGPAGDESPTVLRKDLSEDISADVDRSIGSDAESQERPALGSGTRELVSSPVDIGVESPTTPEMVAPATAPPSTDPGHAEDAPAPRVGDGPIVMMVSSVHSAAAVSEAIESAVTVGAAAEPPEVPVMPGVSGRLLTDRFVIALSWVGRVVGGEAVEPAVRRWVELVGAAARQRGDSAVGSLAPDVLARAQALVQEVREQALARDVRARLGLDGVMWPGGPAPPVDIWMAADLAWRGSAALNLQGLTHQPTDAGVRSEVDPHSGRGLNPTPAASDVLGGGEVKRPGDSVAVQGLAPIADPSEPRELIALMATMPSPAQRAGVPQPSAHAAVGDADGGLARLRVQVGSAVGWLPVLKARVWQAVGEADASASDAWALWEVFEAGLRRVGGLEGLRVDGEPGAASLSTVSTDFSTVLLTYNQVYERLTPLDVELPTVAQLQGRVPEMPGVAGPSLTEKFQNALSGAARMVGGEAVADAVRRWVELVDEAARAPRDRAAVLWSDAAEYKAYRLILEVSRQGFARGFHGGPAPTMDTRMAASGAPGDTVAPEVRWEPLGPRRTRRWHPGRGPEQEMKPTRLLGERVTEHSEAWRAYGQMPLEAEALRVENRLGNPFSADPTHPPREQEPLQTWLSATDWSTSRQLFDLHQATLLGDGVNETLRGMIAAEPADDWLAVHGALLALAREGLIDVGYRYVSELNPDQRKAALFEQLMPLRPTILPALMSISRGTALIDSERADIAMINAIAMAFASDAGVGNAVEAVKELRRFVDIPAKVGWVMLLTELADSSRPHKLALEILAETIVGCD